LRARRLGDVGIDTRSVAGQLSYLRSCRNSATLREIVVDALIVAGEPSATSSTPAATAMVRSKAWPQFAAALADALCSLTERQYLILERRDVPWYVQFAAQGNYGLRGELVSNAY